MVITYNSSFFPLFLLYVEIIFVHLLILHSAVSRRKHVPQACASHIFEKEGKMIEMLEENTRHVYVCIGGVEVDAANHYIVS